jgi:hypothetical protein
MVNLSNIVTVLTVDKGHKPNKFNQLSALFISITRQFKMTSSMIENPNKNESDMQQHPLFSAVLGTQVRTIDRY